MKKILLALTLLCLSGCVTTITGTSYISGTNIGIKAGYSDGATVMIGYSRFEAVQCKTEANVSIEVDGEIMATGINGKQSAKFGDIANGK
jgi:hypothetical protein